jgi:hypothetical protein
MGGRNKGRLFLRPAAFDALSDWSEGPGMDADYLPQVVLPASIL